MSTTKKTIAIYSNLPSGGALETYKLIVAFLRQHYNVKILREPNYHIHNFLHYLYVAIIASQVQQKIIIHNTPHDLLLVFSSWLVKAPSILRFSAKPKIYICHEPMREYYDKEHVKTQELKDRLINILRLPLMILDYYNIRSKNTIIISNSNFSKYIINKAYGIDSVVVHPGIATSNYRIAKNIPKMNQVICVSSINKLKNQLFLIQVVGTIPIIKRPSLVLIGNGADPNYLKKLVIEANKLNVKIRIKLNVSEKFKILELYRSKVFLYSPVSEPFGIVVEEAIAAGLPILTYSKGGGYTEILKPDSGTILNNLNQNIWARELDKFLTNTDITKMISKYNIRYANKYLDASKMNKKILKIINSTIL